MLAFPGGFVFPPGGAARRIVDEVRQGHPSHCEGPEDSTWEQDVAPGGGEPGHAGPPGTEDDVASRRA
eukprot:12970158-Alexandrium_andersonii.AAC.1